MSKTTKDKAKKTGSKSKGAARTKKTEDHTNKPTKDVQNFISSNSKHILIVTFVALLSIGGFVSWAYWSIPIESYLSSMQWKTNIQAQTPNSSPATISKISNEQLAIERQKLSKSLKSLMERIKAIEISLGEVKKLAQATTPLSEKMNNNTSIKDLTGRLVSLEKNDATIKELLKRMKQIKEDEDIRKKNQANSPNLSQFKIREENSKKNFMTSNDPKALVLSAENLRKAIGTNKPFNKALNDLKKIARGNLNINTAILVLTKTAQTGIPTLSQLKENFNSIAGKIVNANRYNNAVGWQARIKNRLSSLVMWRRIDGKGGSASIDTIVVSVEKELMSGNLSAAVSIVESLSTNQKNITIVKKWLDNAQNRIAAERAINSLHIYAVSKLTKKISDKKDER